MWRGLIHFLRDIYCFPLNVAYYSYLVLLLVSMVMRDPTVSSVTAKDNELYLKGCILHY